MGATVAAAATAWVLAGAGPAPRAAGADVPVAAKPANAVRLHGRLRYVLGSPAARVVLVEFGDYQCPFCRRHHREVFARLKADYVDTGKVRYVVRDLPLEMHADAFAAAVAARCAGAQGRFWPMRDALLASSDLSRRGLAALARSVGLAAAPFQSCLKDKRVAAEVRRDVADARAVGITVTPSFVIGTASADGVSGTRLAGAKPYAAFAARIERLLHTVP